MRNFSSKKCSKIEGKNDKKFSQKNECKNPVKNPSKNLQKSRGNSRTMEWLKIPPSKQREFRNNLITMEVDFMQYTCYKISHPLQNLYNIVGFTGQIDDDNSNVELNHNMNLSLMNKRTDKGHAYIIVFHSPGFAPVPIVSVEVYNDDKVKLLKTEGKIVFYGAYFVFREVLAEEAPEILRFHNSVEFATVVSTQKDTQKHKTKEQKEKLLYKRTRVDIATDVAVPILNNKWLTNYIQPHKNSKQVPRPYGYDPQLECFQSIGYIPRLTQGIGIRVYNKLLDIQNKTKQSWHPTYGTEEQPVVTRIELVFGGDTAQDSIENLMKYTKHRLLGDEETKLKRKIRPKSQYSAISAYEYFKRYAKNHGKTLKEVLDDVTSILIREEQKDKFEAIEIYSIKEQKDNF